ncbi:ABC transporter permease [Ectobacillus panaciterrae]|uniref:ABC transporter permease n=1 Tax=Ectobacillus panaciterrae TaxID=363872 RepID=UPI00041BD378|nr:ABC transporter permease subunit [Ectobacillus panaciterrae]
MFHKALWMRNQKQGKWIVGLFWLGSLYLLPFNYYQAAVTILEQQKHTKEIVLQHPDYHYYYQYYFNSGASGFQTILLIALAALLIGWERNNQSIDLLFSMPFKRRDIFLSKWLFGLVHITGIHIVTYGLMYLVKKTTIHDSHQDFTDFSIFFLVSFVTLAALYTFCLFVGTIAGNIVSQAILSFIFLYLPIGLYGLVSSMIVLHISSNQDSLEAFYKRTHSIQQGFETISLPVPLQSLRIEYNDNPENKSINGIDFGYNPERSESMIFNRVLSTVAIAIAYTLLSLIMGIKLYKKTPNEANGKILLYRKLAKLFIPSVVICCSLLGGQILAGAFSPSKPPLFVFYIATIGVGIITHIILKKLMNTKLSLGSK